MTSRFHSTRLQRLLTLALVATLAFSAGSVYEAISAPSDTTFWACLKTNDGTLYDVSTQSPSACKKGDQAVSWTSGDANAFGPAFVNDNAQEVDDADIAPGGLGTTALADDSVTSAKIADGSVNVNDLASDSVDTDELRSNAVKSDRIANDSITSDDLGTGSVDTDEIETGAVGTSELGIGAVTTDKLTANYSVALPSQVSVPLLTTSSEWTDVASVTLMIPNDGAAHTVLINGSIQVSADALDMTIILRLNEEDVVFCGPYLNSMAGSIELLTVSCAIPAATAGLHTFSLQMQYANALGNGNFAQVSNQTLTAVDLGRSSN